MQHTSCTIFYTDDDKDDQEIFVEAVEEVSADVTVTLQENGDELIRLLHHPPPSPTIIFLDLNMPVKNGYEVLKEIKGSEFTKNLPVVIFTTSDHTSAIETTRKLGANMYIPKPSSFELLKNVIKHILAINWETFSASGKDFVYRAN